MVYCQTTKSLSSLQVGWASRYGNTWLDFGFRWYDPAVARFPSIDPIIEEFPYLTPYNYASNDPIKNIDLWGLQGTFAPLAALNQAVENTAQVINDNFVEPIKEFIAPVAAVSAEAMDEGYNAIGDPKVDNTLSTTDIVVEQTELKNVASDKLKDGLGKVNKAYELSKLVKNYNEMDQENPESVAVFAEETVKQATEAIPFIGPWMNFYNQRATEEGSRLNTSNGVQSESMKASKSQIQEYMELRQQQIDNANNSGN